MKGPVINLVILYICMKVPLFSLETKNIKKSKNNFKATKKSEIVILEGIYFHVNKTSQQYIALYTTYSHVLDGEIKAIATNWCLIVSTWGIHLQHWLSAQRWADGINMWANAVGTFNPPLASVQAYKKFVWVLSRFIQMLIKSKNSEKNKIMNWGIHYFVTKLKTKIEALL